MTLSEETRYALVTGGGNGLGRAFCLRLAGDGWHVAIADADRGAAETTLSLVQQKGGVGQVKVMDVADAGAWLHLRDELRALWPRLDLLVNNAGVCGGGEIGDCPLEVVQKVLRVNLEGVYLGCHTMAPWMKETAPGGWIVNIASIAATLSAPAMGAYSVAKAGVIALSETLLGELEGTGVGVTVAMPGFFCSGLLEAGQFHNEAHRRIVEQITADARLTAERVVDKTLQGVAKGQFYVVEGPRARWLWRLKRLTPVRFIRAVASQYRRRLEPLETGVNTPGD